MWMLLLVVSGGHLAFRLLGLNGWLWLHLLPLMLMVLLLLLGLLLMLL